MKVKELIEILKTCDPELEIATHANNHTFIGKDCRVCLLNAYGEHRVVIGDVSKKDINSPNWFIEKELDNGPKIPDQWPR